MYILLTFDKYLSLSEPFYFDQSNLITLYLYCQVGPRKYKDFLVGYTPMLPLQVTLEQK